MEKEIVPDFLLTDLLLSFSITLKNGDGTPRD